MQEDVDVLGMSLLSGAHMTIFRQDHRGPEGARRGRHDPGRRRRHARRGRGGAQGHGGASEILLQDTPPKRSSHHRTPRCRARRALIAAPEETPHGRHGVLELAAAFRQRLPARRRQPLLVPGARDDAPAARERRSSSACARSRATLREHAPFYRASGTRPDFTRPAAHARGFRGEGAGGHQARSARRAGTVHRRSATTCASPTARCITSTARPARPGGPTAFAIGRGDWDAIANAHARILWGMGLRPGDTVFIAAIFSLYMGSWGASPGVERLRAKAFPFGAGAPGMTARAAHVARHDEAQGFLFTPSFALASRGSRARGRLDPQSIRHARRCSSRASRAPRCLACATGSSPPTARSVIDCGSMAEMTPVHERGRHRPRPTACCCWQDIVYTEVCDPATFRRVPFGQRGTPVYTHLERTSQPMIRLVSGDLALWRGQARLRPHLPRLPQGIFGRIDDMFTIRGENVYPSEVDAVLSGCPATAASTGSSSAATA